MTLVGNDDVVLANVGNLMEGLGKGFERVRLMLGREFEQLHPHADERNGLIARISRRCSHSQDVPKKK